MDEYDIGYTHKYLYTINIYRDDDIDNIINNFFINNNLIYNNKLIDFIKKMVPSFNILNDRFFSNVGIRFFDNKNINTLTQIPYCYLIQLWR